MTFVFKRRRRARSPPGQRRCSHVPAPAPHPQAGPTFSTATWPSQPRGSRLSPGPTPLAAAFLLVACHTHDVRGCSHVPPFPPKCQPHWHGFPQRRSVTMFDSASQEDNFMLPGQAVVRQSLGDALDGGSQVRSWHPTRRSRPGSACESRRGRRRRGRRSEGKESDRGCYFLFCHGTQLPKENSSNAEATPERGRRAWFSPRATPRDAALRPGPASGPLRVFRGHGGGEHGPQGPGVCKGKGPSAGGAPGLGTEESQPPRRAQRLVLLTSSRLNSHTQ